MSGEDFMLKWNDHHKLFFAGAEEIQASEEFTDVTLSAGDRIFRAHKLVLSICSPYFKALFRKLGPEKPVIFLKDINPKHLELLLQYMYRGEIKVQETELVTVLNVAQSLEVRGLTESSEGGRSPRRVSPPPPAPVPAPAAKRQKVERSELSNIVKQETQPAVIDVEQVNCKVEIFPEEYKYFTGHRRRPHPAAIRCTRRRRRRAPWWRPRGTRTTSTAGGRRSTTTQGWRLTLR